MFVLIKDPFGDRRGQFEYSSILTRLQKLKSKLETNPSLNDEQKIDSYTRKIIDAAPLNSNITSNNDIDLDDIFYNDQDEEEQEDEDNLQ